MKHSASNLIISKEHSFIIDRQIHYWHCNKNNRWKYQNDVPDPDKQTYKQNSSDTYHFEVIDSENAHQGNSFFLSRMHSLRLFIHKQDLRFETLSVLLLLMMIMMKNMFVEGQFVCYNEPSCFFVRTSCIL